MREGRITYFSKGRNKGFSYFGEKVSIVADITQNPVKIAKNGCNYVNIDYDPIILLNVIKNTNASVDQATVLFLEQYKNERRMRNDIGDGKLIDINLDYPYETRHYQKIGINLLLFKKKFVLCQEMGLGKSMQALVACKNIKVTPKRILIVCPSYVKREWKDHIERWYPNEMFFARGSKLKREKIIQDFLEYTREKTAYLIINTEMLRDYRILHDTYFNVAILDESYRFQNRKSKQTQGMQLLQAEYMFFLQGILMDKEDPSRIYPILSKIDPLRFKSYWRFVNRYCQVEDTFMGYKKIEGAKSTRLTEWKNVLKDYLLQNTKIEVAPELPDIIYKTIYVPLQQEHRNEYIKIYKNEMIGNTSYPHKIALFEKLRQFLLLPKLFRNSLGYIYKDWQPFTPIVEQIIEDIPADDQLIVFGYHKAYLCELESYLRRQGFSTALITGDVSEKERSNIIDCFKIGKIKIIVANIACLARGMNLDCAKNVIFVEQTWKSEEIDQAIARVHRLTTTESPTVIKLIVNDTISEYIDNVLTSDRAGVKQMDLVNKFVELHNKILERGDYKNDDNE